MSVDNAGARASKKSLWAGRILSGLVVLFLIPDGIFKFIKPAPVVEAFAHVGWPVSLANTLGILLLVCTALYVFPRTSILGAILLTGYLGASARRRSAVQPCFVSDLFGHAALAWTVLAGRPVARTGSSAKLAR
jgi:hypothetical protein